MNLRKFILKTLFTLILPIICSLVVYEYYYREMPNVYKVKESYLTQNASNIEVLILGSSHSYFGIDPFHFSYSAFNAANVSQDLRCDSFIFDKYKESLSNLKTLILPISYFSFWGNLENGNEDWRVRKYNIYMGMNSHPWYYLKYNFEFTQVGNKELFKYFLGLKESVDCDSLGMGTSYTLNKRNKNWKSSGVIAVRRHTIQADSFQLVETMKKNIQYVTSIISECQKHHIEVLLVTMPAYHSYYENLNECQLKLMDKEIQRLILTEGVDYINLLKDERFSDDDFYDADHLNEYGARKVSSILNDILKRMDI